MPIALFTVPMEYRGSTHDGTRAVIRTAVIDPRVDAVFARARLARPSTA
jgi:hypothetical protein